MAKFYLICGSTGAGKSTYAKRLAAEVKGIHFPIDEWMTTLFWQDSPNPIEFEWAMERINRCEAQICALALQCVGLGVPAILDLGFTKASHRQKFADIASANAVSVELHFCDVPQDIRWARVCERNEKRGETFAMEVNRDMFDFVEGLWEPPSADEMQALNGRTV
jgi:predicted kinase